MEIRKLVPLKAALETKQTTNNQHLMKYLIMILTKIAKEFYTEKSKFLSALRKTGI